MCTREIYAELPRLKLLEAPPVDLAVLNGSAGPRAADFTFPRNSSWSFVWEEPAPHYELYHL